MYYLFILNKNRSYGCEDVIHLIDFYSSRFLVIESKNKNQLFDTIFENENIFDNFFLISFTQNHAYSLLLDKQVRKNTKDRIRKIKELFNENYFLEAIERYKRIKVRKFETLKEIENFIEVLENIMKIEIDFNCFLISNFKEIFLKGICENEDDNSIKRFMKNKLFDKNLLPIIFGY
jgi:hypothetical protein